MKTLSALLTNPKTFELAEVELDPLKKNEILIDVLACGICSTELAAYDGSIIGTPGVSFRYKSFPAYLGHEVVGYVLEKGSEVERFDIGDCVTGLTYSGCGFSKHFIEKEDALVKVPDHNKNKQKLYIGEPLMATTNILNQINITFGDTAVVVGDGFMSLLLISALSKYPLEHLIVVGHHDARLKLASKYGATTTINSKIENAWKSIMEITYEQGADISIDYGGNSESLKLAASIAKPKQRSKLILASSYSNEMPFSIGNYLQNRAPILIPAYPNQSPNKMKDLTRGLWGLASGLFPMEELMTHEYKLEEITNAFEDCITRKNGYIKGIILPHD